MTIARAVELKHNPGLISSLAFETSKMYTTAADSLATLDQKIFGHWRQYFTLKTKFYQAYVSLVFSRDTLYARKSQLLLNLC